MRCTTPSESEREMWCLAEVRFFDELVISLPSIPFQ